MKLLQVCNVGRIVGGTAACAWSITRAFPDIEHHVAFLSPISEETDAAFGGSRLLHCERISNSLVRDLGCEAVILHNTAQGRVEPIEAAWTLQYVHSKGTRAAADCTRYCSSWLAKACLGDRATADDVLYQCVPRPVGSLRREVHCRPLVVGRICTPTTAKWPASLTDFYADLAARLPWVWWEFVGCPAEFEPALHGSCNGRAAFHPAGWSARSHLARWDALLYHHPSMTESFGRVVAEAMRAGCVPIVDARGGFLEQVTPASGEVCASTTEFAEALGRLSEDGRRLAMAAEARRRGDELFSLASFRERLLRLWRSCENPALRYKVAVGGHKLRSPSPVASFPRSRGNGVFESDDRPAQSQYTRRF
ncbi:Glycosyl transferases group 1 [Caulifigura coniformis]|uniref:Glycosyl transferases group 1 n=1 Tax=Caulifigura coniformis TaxID=2527983 RepID=A0A517S7R5_9PLAN|nr:glycosyltransferase [Caulifigura coniformis]QDT52167.1 Glycosyl transferases group 1 [Caulifigura coniformis]